MWEISGRHRRPERSHFLKISVQRRHTTPLRPMPQRPSIFRRAHKRAARTATTRRQAAKAQPALRAYATKGRPARSCIASARPRDDQANRPAHATARPRGQKTPASRTQSRIRPESAANRQNPHFRRSGRSKNATGSVLSDFFRGSGLEDLAIRSARQAPPSQRERGIEP